MLVLKRQVHERIHIGDQITIEIVDVRRDGVRIGINAPPSIPVHREEIYRAIKATSTGAVTPPPQESAA